MSRNLRFLHIADTHLGMEFKGQRSKDVDFYQRLRNATYRAFDRVVAHAQEQHVDFIVLAGDIYHSMNDNLFAQGYFTNAARTLSEQNIPLYVVGGNHDPLNNKRLPQPSNVHLLSSDKVERIAVAACNERPSYSIYGRSYAQAEENSNFAKAFLRHAEDENAIGVLHTNVGTSGQGEKYTRASLADLIAADMDYWALGHIHLEEVLHAGHPTIVYPGSTQALHIGEQGRHGCYLVEMNEGLIKHLEWLPTGVIDFALVPIDISDVAALSDLTFNIFEYVSQHIAEFKTEHDSWDIEEFLIRLELVGTKQFSEVLDSAQLVADLGKLLDGSFPKQILIDGKIIDSTTNNYQAAMQAESQLLIRMILDKTEDDIALEEILKLEGISIPKELKDELLLEIKSEGEHLFNQAQELLFARLRKES